VHVPNLGGDGCFFLEVASYASAASRSKPQTTPAFFKIMAERKAGEPPAAMKLSGERIDRGHRPQNELDSTKVNPPTLGELGSDQSAVAFAKYARADTLSISSPCGHTASACEQARIGVAVREFLAR